MAVPPASHVVFQIWGGEFSKDKSKTAASLDKLMLWQNINQRHPVPVTCDLHDKHVYMTFPGRLFNQKRQKGLSWLHLQTTLAEQQTY